MRLISAGSQVRVLSRPRHQSHHSHESHRSHERHERDETPAEEPWAARPRPKKSKQTTVLSVCVTERNTPESKPTAGPRRGLRWFFDICIQGSKNTTLELSLKFGPRGGGEARPARVSVITNFPRPFKRGREE